ncbi:hypothetical protein LTR08_001422 [Meristemomyces frigidus]|nr:hypothetical protein LTR08_001422 [Meristemomyces frigidus]
MSLEWNGGRQPQDAVDAYTLMWESVDNEWNFNDVPADWSVWDEPAGADRGVNEFDPYYSSSAVDGFTSPGRSQNVESGRERGSQIHPPAHDIAGSTSLAPMGNAASTASNRPSQQLEPTAARQAAQSTASRRIPPVADHREDWLALPATDEPSSFGYPDHLFDTLSESPEPQRASHLSAGQHTENDMPPTTRRQRSSFVDLTTGPSSPPQPQPVPRLPKSLKRAVQDAEGGRSAKRSRATSQHVDELDLTEEAPSAEEELQRNQQEKTIAAQQAEQENTGPQKIGQRQCIICMENYTNATVTQCGHIYCHECLTQALSAGEKNNDRGIGSCPVCRKPVSRKKANQMIPLAFMKKSAFKGKAKKNMGLLG